MKDDDVIENISGKIPDKETMTCSLASLRWTEKNKTIAVEGARLRSVRRDQSLQQDLKKRSGGNQDSCIVRSEFEFSLE